MAHVLGTVGLLAASFASAQYARELLTDADDDGFYDVKASEQGKIVLIAKIDQLLDTTTDNGDDLYVRIDFRGDAILSQALGEDPLMIVDVGDHDSDDETPDTEVAVTIDDLDQVRVFGADDGSEVAIYRLRGGEIELPDTGIERQFRVELGNDTIAAGFTGSFATDGEGNPITGAGYLEVTQDAGTIAGTIAVYDSQGDARNKTGTPILSGGNVLLSVSDQTGAATVTPFLATAAVGSAGGPFRQFLQVDPGAQTGHPGTANIGGSTTLSGVGLLAHIGIAQTEGLLDPNTGTPAALASVTATYTVNSVSGNFGFGADVDKPWRVSTDAMCMDGGLDLQVGDDETAADAESATGSHAGTSRYLCVLVGDSNTVQIPLAEGSGPGLLDAYSIDVAPDSGTGVRGAAAGAIARDGTSVNVTYLSANPAYSQRLVIVNRGADAAKYTMSDFQTEDGTVVAAGTVIEGYVPAGGRTVVRTQDVLAFDSGMPRASGTLNMNAPPSTIDVMTVQVHPGTGQVDTTVYQHSN